MIKTTVIILAAGQGKRIKPITTPKPLLSFCGRPLISWIIDDLKSAGLDNLVAVVSPEVHSSQFFDFPTVVQSKSRGMADALLKAKSFIKNDSFIILNGADLLSSSAYLEFLSLIQKNDPKILLTGLKLDHYLPGGYFKLGQNNQPLAVIEKPKPGDEPSPYFNLVLHYFQNASQFFSILKNTKSSKDDQYEKALSKLMAKGLAQLYDYSSYFAQLKYPHQILDMADLFLNHRLDQQSFIDPTAKIMAGAVIKNSYIGQKVIVGNHALIRDSIIEAGSIVGYNTEIARSYIGPNSNFHCNYVGDSVIEGHVNLGSGARLANLRFDKKPVADTNRLKFGAVLAKGVQLGINASIMPGITIGNDSWIGSGVVLNHSVKPKTKIFK